MNVPKMTFEMFMPPHLVCRSKVKYYNLRSAERAAEIFTKAHKTKFEVYKCGTSKHYHLTHTDKSKRIGHGNKGDKS